MPRAILERQLEPHERVEGRANLEVDQATAFDETAAG